MRVIICGAGQVGFSIASYLAREDNDITVIDTNAKRIGQVNAELDANGLTGHAANPDILDRAGAKEADMIIAVTSSDEVNMVACQVAHSLFNVPRKIARIRERAFLDPAWSNLFSRAHMPIDVIISPEVEVAKTIAKRLSVPGSTHLLPLADNRLYMVGVRCTDDTPVIQTPLRQLTQLFPDAQVTVAGIIRDGRNFIPTADDQMLPGDEVFFIVDAGQVERMMSTLGHSSEQARSIVIVGGGNVGYCLTRELQELNADIHIKIIEHNLERAQHLSELLKDTTILNGDGLDRALLDEASIDTAHTMVAVTDDDETNILSSLLSRQAGCKRQITLVNKPTYNTLIGSLGLGTIVSPRATTVSTIMQYVRRGRIKAVHNIRDGFGELIEAEASDSCPIANRAIGDLDLPSGIFIGALVREDGTVIMGRRDTVIRPGDHVVVMALADQARKVEKLFSVHVDLF